MKRTFIAIAFIVVLLLASCNQEELSMLEEHVDITSLEYYKNHDIKSTGSFKLFVTLDDDFANQDIEKQTQIAKAYMDEYLFHVTVWGSHYAPLKNTNSFSKFDLYIYLNSSDKKYIVNGTDFTDENGNKHDIEVDTILSSDGSAGNINVSDTEIWICAQKAIKDNLKSPASAVFPTFSDSYIKSIGNNQYTISAYVDAENSYGASIRSTFSVTIEIIHNGDGFKTIDIYID